MGELDEIRARHQAGERASAVEDREWLLAEVERLREALRCYRGRVRELSTPHGALVAYSDLMDDSGERARDAMEGGR